MERRSWAANAWGDLLAMMPEVEAQPLCEVFQQNFSRLVEQLAGGKVRRFSILMKRSAQNPYFGDTQEQSEKRPAFSWCATAHWLSGECMPRADALLELCYRFHVKPSDLLRTRLAWVIDGDIRKEADLANRGTWRHPPEQMRNVLRAVLTENPPPSLYEVARRLDYRACGPLRRLDPACCERIQVNYRRRRKFLRNKWTVQDRPCAQEEIARILEASLAQDNPVPVNQIAAQLGYETSLRLNRHFPELCRAIAAKQRQNREKRREAIRRGLIAAVREGPPPTMVELMRRLHCYESVVKGLFPDLFTAVVEARKAWQVSQLEQTRAKLDRLAEGMQGASAPSICRAAGMGMAFLINRFPDLYRRIVSKYIQQRDTIRLLRREKLREEVDRIVVELSRKNITPTMARVAELLSDEVTHDWKLISHAVDDARQKRTT